MSHCCYIESQVSHCCYIESQVSHYCYIESQVTHCCYIESQVSHCCYTESQVTHYCYIESQVSHCCYIESQHESRAKYRELVMFKFDYVSFYFSIFVCYGITLFHIALIYEYFDCISDSKQINRTQRMSCHHYVR